jgi:hypothetical protein
MTLIDRIEALNERASGMDALERRRAESAKLQQLLAQARPINEKLGTEIQQMRLLHDEGINVAPNSTSAKAARTTLARLIKRFTENPTADSLTKGRDWKLFESQAQTTYQEVTDALKAAWSQFIATAFTGESPSDLERSLAVTDLNRNQLRLYKQAYTQLNSLGRSRPQERRDFDRVRELARQLGEIYQRFDLKVPEDVKRFLQAVADGGADLDLLTEDVRDWLQEQGSSGHYRIVARTGAR